MMWLVLAHSVCCARDGNAVWIPLFCFRMNPTSVYSEITFRLSVIH